MANEYIQDRLDEPEVEYEDEGVLMEKPFDPSAIKMETKTPSLDTLIKRIRRKNIEMDTSTYFQRKDDLWNDTAQSRLIESILIRFPLPAFFFDASDDDHWLVVDGLQRLSSIRNFVVEKSLKLTNLEFLTQLNGMTWDELPEDLQRRIEETQVVINKILPGTPTDVKFNIFKRINTGGLVLTSQEIRHALFQGAPAKFVQKLAESNIFKKATGGKISTKRMQDRDFANRFLAFYVLGVEQYGTREWGQDIDTFMSKVLEVLYEKTDKELEAFEKAFSRSLKLAYDIFGREAFRKVVEADYKRLPQINKALFEALTTQLALLNEEEISSLRASKDRFKRALRTELSENERFFNAISTATGDKNRTLLRHKTVSDLIQKVIHYD